MNVYSRAFRTGAMRLRITGYLPIFSDDCYLHDNAQTVNLKCLAFCVLPFVAERSDSEARNRVSNWVFKIQFTNFYKKVLNLRNLKAEAVLLLLEQRRLVNNRRTHKKKTGNIAEKHLIREFFDSKKCYENSIRWHKRVFRITEVLDQRDFKSKNQIKLPRPT